MLPQCHTGYVYMIIPLNNYGLCYIGKTINIRRRLTDHNSVARGSTTTIPHHLKPFILFAYVCGFNRDDTRMRYVERKWQERRDLLIQNGNNCIIQWAQSVLPIISQDHGGYSDLTLVELYR